MSRKTLPLRQHRPLALLIASLFIAGTPFTARAGETILYDGSNPGMLQGSPSFVGSSSNNLFPGTTAAPAASGNTVTVDYASGMALNHVFGGISDSGAASDNSVNLIRGEVGYIYGGWSNSGNATHNTVNIAGGGSVQRNVYGGFSRSGNATHNTVNIAGGGTVKGDVYGGYSNSGNATDNTVIISGGSIQGYVIGGYSTGNNTTAANNTVNITGVTVKGDVYGGYSHVSSNITATHNTVNITGGSVEGDVIGGHVSGNFGTATHNTVNITGNPVFDGSTNLYGGGAMVPEISSPATPSSFRTPLPALWQTSPTSSTTASSCLQQQTEHPCSPPQAST